MELVKAHQDSRSQSEATQHSGVRAKTSSATSKETRSSKLRTGALSFGVTGTGQRSGRWHGAPVIRPVFR